ncbi:5-oxoprolinase subunit PxpB [Lewinella sp. JB7]|uniref:5-oxoprolinase subunit PxpB n=1 Tax=Lewinella sp. JB7 TaxID=2962887 RepID=UPI0020C955A2|nr:5-oxoprolinase subunit PxpB [Lewinella sp. JB7]
MRRPRRILPYGPAALLLEWEQRIATDINLGVHAYASAIRILTGVAECIPGYASLLVRYRPTEISGYDLCERLLDLPVRSAGEAAGYLHELPVCYAHPFAPDLPGAARKLGLTDQELIAQHTETRYHVYLIGFRPGFAFMGEVPEAIRIARRSSPRTRVPAGSVGIAGGQTGIYPEESPGGWQLIGRCPLPLLSVEGTTRLRAGDQVSFRAVSEEEYHHLSEFPSPWPAR